jgi:thiosulfate dehydrogenase [quinone] large subunit
MNLISNNTRGFRLVLLLLRIAIGWHFLYEGIAKLYSPLWSSYDYLSVSKWIFSGFFHWLASTPELLKIVDLLNIWGLILIGLALFLGVFTRLSSILGIILLSLYYLANPPFVGMDFGVPAEGHYLIVNKTLLELVTLCIFLMIPPKSLPGFERLFCLITNHIQRKKKKKAKIPVPAGQGAVTILRCRRHLMMSLSITRENG